eukprot:scaffold1428_cov159-Amphora_coffeaeformis.AAC.18
MKPRSKSLAVKYHLFCSKFSLTTCVVIPVASADNHADIFTSLFHSKLLLDTARTSAVTVFVHMVSSIYSHIDNPVQDYSPNKKS